MEKMLLCGNRCLEEKDWGTFPPWITMGGVAFYAKNKLLAKNNDAQNQPQRFPASGSFVNSRFHLRTNRDRGNRGRLIG